MKYQGKQNIKLVFFVALRDKLSEKTENTLEWAKQITKCFRWGSLFLTLSSNFYNSDKNPQNIFIHRNIDVCGETISFCQVDIGSFISTCIFMS